MSEGEFGALFKKTFAVQEVIHLLILEGSTPIDPERALVRLRGLHPKLDGSTLDLRAEIIKAAEEMAIEVKPDGEVSAEAP